MDQDTNTSYVRTAATTTNNASAGQMLPGLLGQVDQPIVQVSADGGYDLRTCYEAAATRGQSRHPDALKGGSRAEPDDCARDA